MPGLRRLRDPGGDAERSCPSSGSPRERIVFITGIGCAARFPYYMNTYGMHSIHGRAPAIATGLAVSRPDLSVWVVTGDGDALSIGGNHLIHALRRNVNLKILLFNNQIYGLTKGQYSPTQRARQGDEVDADGIARLAVQPAQPRDRRRGDVRRPRDRHRQGRHARGAARGGAHIVARAFVEIFQNCPIFNDGAFAFVRDDKEGRNRIVLRHGEPIRWGEDGEKGLRQRLDGSITTCDGSDPRRARARRRARHAASLAFALSRVTQETHGGTPVGVFRGVERPVYDDLMAEQIATATEQRGPGDLAELLHSGETWTIS